MPQVPALVGTYRVIRYDARGHGSSSVPAGNYSIEQLGRDALAILDAEGARQAHVCGISLGGLTAMWLGVNAADRVSSLVLANTAARIGTVQSWTDRIALVQERGMRGVADLAMPMWFSPDFRQRHEDVVTRFKIDGRGVPADGLPGLLRGAAGRGSAGGDLENQLSRSCGRGSHRCTDTARSASRSSTSASPARRC